MMRNRQSAFLLFAAEVAICACCFGQQPQKTSNQFPAKSAAAHLAPAHEAKPSPSVPETPVPPVSIVNQPASPASVALTGGELSIKANNSTLADILDQIAKASGMEIDGLQNGGAADQRIFGAYGPGQPREVLSQLLDGCGFNVIMLGKLPDGIPKTLSLSPRAPGGLPNPPAQSVAAQYQNYRENYPAPPTQYPQPQNNAPDSNTQQPRNGVRTPQQILQELERMRGRQQQPPN